MLVPSVEMDVELSLVTGDVLLVSEEVEVVDESEVGLAVVVGELLVFIVEVEDVVTLEGDTELELLPGPTEEDVDGGDALTMLAVGDDDEVNDMEDVAEVDELAACRR